MLVYLRLLSESFRFAINALRNNKLRTLLSLLGVTIGIFSIDPLNPSVELIFNVADCSFLFQNNQATAIGTKRNSQKNSGFKKVIFPIIAVLFEVQQILGFSLKFHWHIYRLLRER